MKKLCTLFLAAICVGSVLGQRISSLTIDGVTALTPFGAFNPTNNNAAKAGDGQIVFPPNTDLTNVNVTITAGTTTITPNPLPTDWSAPVTVRVTDESAEPTKWADYVITAKVIKPTTLPFELKTGAGNFDSNSWTSATEGWAGAAIDKNQNIIRFGSANRSFVTAFTDAPDSLYFTIKFLTTEWDVKNVFDVEGSADGSSWTTIVKYDANKAMPLSADAKEIGFEIDNSFRFVRWVYTKRNSTNVSVENIKITKKTDNPGTGILTPQEQSIKAYFNASEIQLANADLISNISLYNTTGALVLSQNNPAALMDASNMSNGVYIAKISTTAGNTISMKLIKK